MNVLEESGRQDMSSATLRVTELVECAGVIASLIPIPTPGCVKAVVLIPGCGQEQRITDGLRLATAIQASTIIWAGQNEEEMRVCGRPNEGKIRQAMTTLPDGVPASPFERVILNPMARHSKDQAEFVLAAMQEHGIDSCLITVPGWHMMRLYLTFVATAVQMGFFPKLFPFPVAGDAPIKPESQKHLESGYGDIWQASAGELTRCLEYRKDVADLRQLRTYIEKAGIL
ncbi:MAG: hypothetical protein RL141_427 [Candidatus Parcubacteria bacterium]|jgi:hypothetical protein